MINIANNQWHQIQESEMTKNIWAYGHFIAEGMRDIELEELDATIDTTTQKLEKNKYKTLSEILKLWYLYTLDDEGKCYFMGVARDENWNPIIDKEKQNVLFQDGDKKEYLHYEVDDIAA